jgi:LysR family transcriptional regulator, regulator for metE and metH
LFVSQPALSQRLAKMERRLDTELFDRVGRRLVPNAAGRRMLLASRRVLAELDAAERDVRDIRAGRDRRLRFAAQCTTALPWLSATLGGYRQHQPDVEVRIVTVVGDRPVTALLDDEIDVALVTKPDSRMDEVDLVELFEDEMVAVVRSGHPWEGRAYVTAQDITDAHLILYDAYDQSAIPAPPLPLPHGARPGRITYMPVVTELVIALVAASDGAAVLPNWVASPYLETHGLAAVRLGAQGMPRTWYCASRRGPKPDHIADFIAQVTVDLAVATAPTG